MNHGFHIFEGMEGQYAPQNGSWLKKSKNSCDSSVHRPGTYIPIVYCRLLSYLCRRNFKLFPGQNCWLCWCQYEVSTKKGRFSLPKSIMTHPGTNVGLILLDSMFCTHLRHIKTILFLSIKKIGCFERMGIKKMSVSFN